MPLAGASRGALAASMPVKAVAFDAFPIFDPRSIFAAVKQRFPEQGEALGQLWFTKIFPSTWLRTTARQYAGFDVVAAQAFDAASATLDITTKATDRDALVAAFFQMELWPPRRQVARRLPAARATLGLSRQLVGSDAALELRRAGIEGFFQAASVPTALALSSPRRKPISLALRNSASKKRRSRSPRSRHRTQPAQAGSAIRPRGQSSRQRPSHRCAASGCRPRLGGARRSAAPIRLNR